ncbi:MAG: molybdopterin-dependent oxidoreductase [Candidatus Hydrogenedentes bacterium]|nr:molybdopterin-dependent oxidoreductase [Candidatus Hydrogenedentota bacterium]
MMRPKLDPAGFHSRVSLAPHQLSSDVTPREDLIVLCHVGVPRIERLDWSLTVDGLVQKPARLAFADLSRFRQRHVSAIHECAGSPLAPQEPKRRITNVEWKGVLLADLLEECGLSADANYIWSIGADYGEFAGVSIDEYVKDLPIERLSDDVLIATELNGEPLTPEHGFPARLVVPGFYGTNSVKWLTRVSLQKKRAQGPFTTRWYNDVVLDEHGRATGQMKPVWNVAPESVIVSPAPSAQLSIDQPCEVWGRAWGDTPIEVVEVSFDEGETWMRTFPSTRLSRSWQRFSIEWKPRRKGIHQLMSRAWDSRGNVQPPKGARNAIYSVQVEVV